MNNVFVVVLLYVRCVVFEDSHIGVLAAKVSNGACVLQAECVCWIASLKAKFVGSGVCFHLLPTVSQVSFLYHICLLDVLPVDSFFAKI